jgi:hypothetical protein
VTCIADVLEDLSDHDALFIAEEDAYERCEALARLVLCVGGPQQSTCCSCGQRMILEHVHKAHYVAVKRVAARVSSVLQGLPAAVSQPAHPGS